MTRFDDKQVIQSWHINAKAWIDAVQNQEIESRNTVTNKAIVDVVMERSPSSVLDIGCGEGWLSRALVERNVAVSGVDVVPELIENARKLCDGIFHVCSYEELANKQIFENKFDAVVCNFSLVGKDDVESLIYSMPDLLNPKGVFLIQTLHPSTWCEDGECEDGWRQGSWDGFGTQFKNPAPWYYRSIDSWKKLLDDCGLRNVEVREPCYPGSGKPASVIFISES